MRDILNNFQKHVEDVDRLIAFDRDVMQVAIGAVEDLHNRLAKQGVENDQMNGSRTLKLLRGIRDNESLKPRFSLILNQAIVLLVSYFGSAIEDIFCYAISTSLRSNSVSRLRREELKITVAELLDAVANSEDALAELFIEKKDLSFQDMQAIQRAFRDYLGVEIQKDEVVNNIIVAQACRHVIVHAGGEITSRLIKQVSGATPRSLKSDISAQRVVNFTQDEVKDVAESMKQYLVRLVENTEAVLVKAN